MIYGDVVPGFFGWASRAKAQFKLVIYSSRSSSAEGRTAMWHWLKHQWGVWAGSRELAESDVRMDDFEFAHEKPPAWITIDDRCIRFMGIWDAPELQPEALRSFKPWNWTPPA